MAIEFNGKGKIDELKINRDLPQQKNVVKEENIDTQQAPVDNKFIKELGQDLLTANTASAYGVQINKPAGTKIDKEFWGDTLNNLNLKDIEVTDNTAKGITKLENTFAMLDMENKMAESPFIQALNKEFNI